ncbi:NINE protein [Paenibacillus sp. M1]|uniref:NINE protein n=1 Tax=Paenibacillus haidiansis TaxID=1574488 RepID=A0ABU7VXK7_9BACL
MNNPKQALSTNELLILSSEVRKWEKSLPLAYLMLLAGHMGLHRFYLRRPASGTIQLVLFLLTTLCYFGFYIVSDEDYAPYSDNYGVWVAFLILTLLFGLALGIWVIVDVCLLPGMVKKWNAVLEQMVVDQIVSFRGPSHPGTGSVKF